MVTYLNCTFTCCQERHGISNWFTLFISGLEFWKVGSRKLFAVPEDEIRRQNKEKPIGAKRKRNKADNDIIHEVIESTLENLLEDITDVKKDRLTQSIFHNIF